MAASFPPWQSSQHNRMSSCSNLGCSGLPWIYTKTNIRTCRSSITKGGLILSAPTIPETIAMTNFADNASKPGAFSSWTYFELKHDFRPLWRYLLNNGKTEFYVANSHQTPIGSPVLDDNAKAMVDVLKERGCGFTSVYAANLVEILSVRCSR